MKDMPPYEPRDLYQEVTNKVLEFLEKGTAPWRSPFKRSGGDGFPKNFETLRRYRGINLFLLAMRSFEGGFSSDFWLTYKQAQARGGHVKKGEKSSLVVFWKQIEKPDETTGKITKIPMLRHYHVFNVEQCENIAPPDSPAADKFDPIAEAERIVGGYQEPPELKVGGNRAYYSPLADKVTVPKPQKFESGEAYYATLFHELSHSTGHSKRLNRGLDEKLADFGSPDYGREELVAEMSAAFLAATSGISPPTIAQSAAYLDGWRKTLKGDKRLVVLAAGAAQRSADWILGQRGPLRDERSSNGEEGTAPALTPDP